VSPTVRSDFGRREFAHERRLRAPPEFPLYCANHVPLRPNIIIITPWTMAAKSVPVSAPGLASPRSPTLSDFGMILPDDPLRSYSPSPYIERPPSPPSLLYSHANRSAHTIKQGSAPQHWRRPSLSVTSPPLSAQSSRSTLRTMGDSAVAPKTPGTNNDHLASSPTIQDALSSHVPNGWSSGQQSRRLSSTSSSVHSEDLENIKWPAFAESGGFDDSGVVLEDDDDEDTDQFPVDVRAVNDAGKDPWMDGQSDSEEDNGEYSSAALSKRAEIILANAKKRLNVCILATRPDIQKTLTMHRSWKGTCGEPANPSSSHHPLTTPLNRHQSFQHPSQHCETEIGDCTLAWAPLRLESDRFTRLLSQQTTPVPATPES
jgi:hypothetical protein